MTKFNLRRLRYLLPVLLAALCLARGLTLTGTIERTRAASQRTVAALLRVHEAAELVTTAGATGVREAWELARPELDRLSRDKFYGGEQFREQISLTAALLAPEQPSAARADVSSVLAGWHRVEGELTRRLMADLTGPGDQAAAIALLAALGCVACALLLWQTWNSGQLRRDAALMESSLRENESRCRSMAESARESLVQADPSGRILRSNHKLAAATMDALFDSRDTWREGLGAVTASGGATALPPREVWLAGQSEARLAEWRILPVVDSAGRLVRIDSALLDVTAWHSARQAAQANRAELEHAAQKLQLQLRELLDQSFELAEARTSLKRAGEARMEALLNWGRRVAQPLGDAAAISARLRSQGSMPLSPGEITALVEAVDSVSASLRALADFAGLERGPLQLTPAAFSPRALVEDAVSDIAERAEAANLELPCFVHQNVPAEVVADAHRLREALGHVLEHSIAHTLCGEVSVRLTLGGRAGSLAHLRLEVEDTGAGYSPDDLAAAFEPFHPGLAPTEVASRLAFAKRLLERMGGHFGAESEPGQGTRVWLSVPTEASAGEENGNRIPEMSELKDRHILIVDDAASQRGALVEMAETLGLRAKACASVEEAAPLLHAAAFAGAPFSFVLVDDEVPGIRSKALVSGIASDATVEDTQVFLMVPYSMRAMCTAPVPAGIQGIVAKPVRLRALTLALTGGRPVEWGVSTPAAPPEPPRAAPGSPCVLIVEDNLVNQRVAVRLVEKMGYRAAVVSNGREAVQSFQRGHYDLILMDCQMPEVDGFTATAEIRRLEASGSRMPIIAMTANAMRGDREKCIAAGMDDYISKPVAFEDLRKLVTRWLARAEVARL